LMRLDKAKGEVKKVGGDLKNKGAAQKNGKVENSYFRTRKLTSRGRKGVRLKIWKDKI